MTGLTIPLITLLGAALMLLSLAGALITLILLKKRKKKLTAALQAEYGDLSSLRR